MAKVSGPSDNFKLIPTQGEVINLTAGPSGYRVRFFKKKKWVDPLFLDYILQANNLLTQAWYSLSPEEKTPYNDAGIESGTTGYKIYLRTNKSGLFSNRYGQNNYGKVIY
jgi:hypothetical protein